MCGNKEGEYKDLVRCWRGLFVFCCRLLEERMLIEDLEHDEFSVMSKRCNRDRPKGIN